MSMALNWVDYLFITIFAFSIIAGFGRGLVREIISLVALVAAAYLAIHFSPQLAAHFAGEGQTATNFMLVTSFLLIFVVTIVVGALVSYLLSLIFQFGGLGVANRFLGALFGVLRAAILSIVIIFVVGLMPTSSEQVWQESKFVIYFQPWADWISKSFAPAIEDIKNKAATTMDSVKEKVNSSMESVTAPVSTPAAPVESAEPAPSTPPAQ